MMGMEKGGDKRDEEARLINSRKRNEMRKGETEM